MARARKKTKASRRRTSAKRPPAEKTIAEDEPRQWPLVASLLAVVLLVGAVAGVVIYNDEARSTMIGMIDQVTPPSLTEIATPLAPPSEIPRPAR